MPKQKKQPRNAMYFYMAERKKQLESQGHRFPGGMKDIFSSCGGEWKELTKEFKTKYEEMAKEDKEKEKYNLDNKFTTAGESYAQVIERQERLKEKAIRMDAFIEKLAFNESNGRRPQDRVYIIIKCLHSVAEDKKEGKVYWPAEIALTAFSLNKGMLGVYSTLVDTLKVPLGYLSEAKDSAEEYGILMPGSENFLEKHCDYGQLIQEVKGFIQNWLEDYDDDENLALFCLPGEIEPARQSLCWLIQNMGPDNKEEQQFWTDLEFCDLSRLMVKMSIYGKKINPKWPSQLADLKLDQTAFNILSCGSYDYRSEITCSHHVKSEACQKMNWCSRNVVLRRMFLIFKEFLPQYNIEMKARHDIESIPKQQSR